MISGDDAGENGPHGDCASRVDIHIDTAHRALCPSEDRLTRLTESVLGGEGIAFDSIGIILADHDVVTDLNRRFLDHDWPTDVLSFRLNEEGPIEGEVYVDVETALERCEEFEVTAADELLRYVVHGLLHLAGHDDHTDEQRARMRSLENRYLAS